MVQVAKTVAHDLVLTEDEFNSLVDGPVTSIMVVDDDPEYEEGDRVHFRCFDGDVVKWFAGRTIAAIDRKRKTLEPGTCILVLN